MIRTGYWYDVESANTDVVQIKLIPSERWLESQDPMKGYYEVLEWRKYPNTQREDIVSVINGTKGECALYIEKNYKVKEDDFIKDRVIKLRDELINDTFFLRKSIDKKYKEIACHIDDVLEKWNNLFYPWHTGTPTGEGWYLCWVSYKKEIAPMVYKWKNGKFMLTDTWESDDNILMWQEIKPYKEKTYGR